MNITDYIHNLSRRDAVKFRKHLVYELGIAASYARHICNGTRPVPKKYAYFFLMSTGGVVTD